MPDRTTAEEALADLRAGVAALATKFRNEAAQIRDSTAKTVLNQNADMLDHLLSDPAIEDPQTRHLLGWAPGNLQHHLIYDHGVSPSDVPYDGALDDIHAAQHANQDSGPHPSRGER